MATKFTTILDVKTGNSVSRMNKLLAATRKFNSKGLTAGITRALQTSIMLAGVLGAAPKVVRTKFTADVGNVQGKIKTITSLLNRLNKTGRLPASATRIQPGGQPTVAGGLGLTGLTPTEQKAMLNQQLGIVSGAGRNLTRDISKDTIKTARATAKIARDNKKITTEQGKQKAKLSAIVAQHFSISRMVSRISFVLTAQLSYKAIEAIQRGLAAIVTNAIKFEERMASVYTLLEKNQKFLKGMIADEAIQNMKKYGESLTETTRALYDILSARIPPEWAGYVLSESMKAAVAGFSNVKVAGNAITTLLNSFGKSASEAGDAADWLFQVIKYGKTTLEELQPNLGKITATANLLGFSMEEIGAAMATMTQIGIGTDVAITSLRQLMLTLAAPTDKAKKIFDKYGISMDIATIKQEGFAVTVRKLIGLTDQEIVTLAKSKRGFMALATAMGVNGRYAQNYANMQTRAGAASEAFEIRSKTLDFQLKKLGKVFVDIGIKLGNKLVEPMKNAISSLYDFLEGLNNIYVKTILLTTGILMLGKAFYSLGKAILVAKSSAPLWLALSIAVGSIIATIGKYNKLTKKTSSIMGELNEEIKRTDEISRNYHREEVTNLIILEKTYTSLRNVKDKNEAQQKRYNEAVAELINISPEYLSVLNDEKTTADEIATAFIEARKSRDEYYKGFALEQSMKKLAGKQLELQDKIYLNEEAILRKKEEIAEAAENVYAWEFEEAKKLGMSKAHYDQMTITSVERIKKKKESLMEFEEKKLKLEREISYLGTYNFNHAKDMEAIQTQINKRQEEYNTLIKEGQEKPLTDPLKEAIQNTSALLVEKERAYKHDLIIDEKTGNLRKKTHDERMKDAREYAIVQKKYVDLLTTAQSNLTDEQRKSSDYGNQLFEAQTKYYKNINKMTADEYKNAVAIIKSRKKSLELIKKETTDYMEKAKIISKIIVTENEQIKMIDLRLKLGELLTEQEKEKLKNEKKTIQQSIDAKLIERYDIQISRIKYLMSLQALSNKKDLAFEKELKVELLKLLELKLALADSLELNLKQIESLRLAIAGLKKELGKTEEAWGDWRKILGIANFKTAAEMINSTYSKMNQAIMKGISTVLQHQLNMIERGKEARLNALEEEYDGYRDHVAGTILTEGHKAKVMAALKKKEEEEKEKIEKIYAAKMAKKKKQNARAEAIIDFAKGLIGIWSNSLAQLNPALGAILSALLGGVFTAQMAVIEATKFGEGGFLKGKSHKQGGIPFTVNGVPGFEAEGGEHISQKKAVRGNENIYAAMNDQLAKGKSFAQFAVEYLQGKVSSFMPRPQMPKLAYATGGFTPTPTSGSTSLSTRALENIINVQNEIMAKTNTLLENIANSNNETMDNTDSMRKKGSRY